MRNLVPRALRGSEALVASEPRKGYGYEVSELMRG